jgi:glutamate-1-semialdehyde 2,1-aminomutase
MGKILPTAFDYDLNRRTNLSIAQGALTNSKRPECLVRGVYPTHARSAQGCTLTSTTGKTYIDYICGLGSCLLGYAHVEVNQAISEAAQKGSVYSIASETEVLAAERVKELFPFIDRLKFLKTGTDACNAAVRIARAYTGRKFVYSEAYHGWGDEFVSLSKPALGVVSHGYMRTLPKDFHEVASDTAAIIIEPVMTDFSQERFSYLQRLRDFCTKNNIVLIYDEVITGFRVPKLSVAEHTGIRPDLICLGKAMANGLPISVVGGRKDIMECGEYFVSSTFAGETLSLSAALKVMSLITSKYRVDDLWAAGAQFQKKFNALMPGKLWIEGYPTRGVFKGDELIKALFWQECAKAGILFGPSWFFNFAHIDVTDQVINTADDILKRIQVGAVQLEGQLPTSPFAQKLREQK